MKNRMISNYALGFDSTSNSIELTRASLELSRLAEFYNNDSIQANIHCSGRNNLWYSLQARLPCRTLQFRFRHLKHQKLAHDNVSLDDA